MKTAKDKRFSRGLPYLLLFLFAGLLLRESACLTHCLGKGFLRDIEGSGFTPVSEMFFLARGDGSYTLAEAVFPKEYDGSMPLVAMGHGFTGNRNSGGARELAERLAALVLARQYGIGNEREIVSPMPVAAYWPHWTMVSRSARETGLFS